VEFPSDSQETRKKKESKFWRDEPPEKPHGAKQHLDQESHHPLLLKADTILHHRPRRFVAAAVAA
jgi:hypothetical protein